MAIASERGEKRVRGRRFSASSTSARLTLDNHLCQSLPTQCLRADEPLALDAREAVAERCQQEQQRRRDQTVGVPDDEREPEHDGHGEVDSRTHVVGLESSDELIELL